MIDRIERISKQLKKEIYAILQEAIDDPRLKDVVITSIEVSRDLRLAKVYVYLEGLDAKEKKYVLAGLMKAGGHIRGEVSKRVPMKYTPKISFRFDEGEAKKRHIDDIFKQIQDEHGEDVPDNEKGIEYEQE